MEQKKPTMPVPAAGRKYYGLGRNASYAAAKRGEIPTIQIGGRIFAIVPVIERQLGLLGDHQGPAKAPIPRTARACRKKRSIAQVSLLGRRIIVHSNTE
jgi:hypothetical protein